MAAGAEGEIGASDALGDQTVAVIDFFFFGGGEGKGVVVVVVDDVEGGAEVPAVGFPEGWFGEVRGDFGGDAWCGEEDVRGGDRVWAIRGLDGRFDFAHDGVDGRV